MKRKNKNGGFFCYLKSIADIPGDVGNEFSLSMRGDREIYISGCRRILEYSRERIVLSDGKYSVTFLSEMSCGGVKEKLFSLLCHTKR